jgi:hypothetical protein
MTPITLRVRARDALLVQDHERLEAGVNAFVGHRFVPRADAPGQYGFKPTGGIVELPYRAEYVLALRHGDLLPADEETAKVAGTTLAAAEAAAPTPAPAPVAPVSALVVLPAPPAPTPAPAPTAQAQTASKEGG